MGIEVGKIVEVRGVSVKAELYELMPPYIIKNGTTICSPRINSFVKTRVGLDDVICQITGEYYDGQKKGDFTGYFLDLTVRGYFEGESFVQGLRVLPMVGASLELLEAREFRRINKCYDDKNFEIGTDLFDNNQKYSLSYNTIIPSHIGIFGNTGSGKSNTLAKIMHEYSKKLQDTDNGKLLIIDINNEYGENAVCSVEEKLVYGLTTRKESEHRIPINYDELDEDEWCVLLKATEATQKPVIKTAFKEDKTEEQYKELLILMIKTGQHALVKSMQYYMKGYIYGIEGLKWFSKYEGKFFVVKGNGDWCFSNEDDFTEILDNIRIEIPENKLEKFMFKLYFSVATHIGYGTQYDFVSPLLRRAEKLFADFNKVFVDKTSDVFDGRNIAVIQLANVNKDMMEIIPSIVISHMFQKQIEKKGDGKIKDIINVAIDEAHNLLYEDEKNLKHNEVTLETFERAVKEGRKFGMFLWISSQRPSDISSTIISQMHNYFIHKLVNPYDLAKIRKAVTFLDQNALDNLTVLGPGECVISGTGVNMPCFVRVKQLDEDSRPNSENVKLFGEGGIFEITEEAFDESWML